MTPFKHKHDLFVDLQDFLKDKIAEYFKKEGMAATVKYIDPSYMIRSVPANASDALMCMLLAQNSVHGGRFVPLLLLSLVY